MPTPGQQTGAIETRSVTCDTDLSSKEGYAVNFDATDDNNVNIGADATLFPFVLQEGAAGAVGGKKSCTIAISGRSKVKLGGTVAPGDPLTSDSSGKWVKTTTNHDKYGAIACQIGVANDIVEVSCERGFVSA